MAKKKKWIQKAKIKKGALHKDLGVPMGKKIPKAKLDAAAKKGGKIGRRARLAKTFAKMRKKKWPVKIVIITAIAVTEVHVAADNASARTVVATTPV